MKTRITLEPSELDEDLPPQRAVTEIWVCVERDGGDPEVRSQDLFLFPEEAQDLYHRMRLYYENGTWTTGVVEW